MKVIAVLNQKGGSGKTTISTHLARAFVERGKRVIIADSDPQGSARDWGCARWSENIEPVIDVVGMDRPTIERSIKPLADSVDIVIIDGAPQAHDLAASAIAAADMVLIPVQPSPYDVWAATDLVDLVKSYRIMKGDALDARFVISRAMSGTALAAEINESLKQFKLPVCQARIMQRTAYAKTAINGTTVIDEGKNKDAIAEVMALCDEVGFILYGESHD